MAPAGALYVTFLDRADDPHTSADARRAYLACAAAVKALCHAVAAANHQKGRS